MENEEVMTGEEVVPAAEEQVPEGVVSEPGETEVAAEPEKQNNFEKAFAKRLSAAQEKWEREASEKYKDYDTHKQLSEYMQQINGKDAMSIKEQIEMERLQERADQNEISPEMQKRLESLEAKAAKADELEQRQSEDARIGSYFNSLETFSKDKGIESSALNAFMVENELPYNPDKPESSFNVAFKAMKADELEQQLASAKESAVKEYLQSKNAPRVEGSGTPGVVQEDTSKMSWTDINKRLADRISANQST